MNSVNLIGRLTRDPETRYTDGANPMAITSFSIAIDRQGSKEKQTDFPSIKCFGKTAELVEKYMGKGRLIGIQGRIQTGSYKNKDGNTVYTTDVIADRVEFLDRAEKPAEPAMKPAADDVPQGFSQLAEDLPF